MKTNPYIFSLFMFVGLILVIMPTMPHHHHSDNVICMKNDINTDDCCSSHHTPHHHPYDDPCCTDTCHTQMIRSESALQHAGLTIPFQVQEVILSFTPLIVLPAPPDNITRYRDYVYIESLHGAFITCAAGLRAPPSLLTA